MKYHIPKGTKIRRIRWTGETEEFVTTRDATFGDSDVLSVVEKEQSFLEFKIPIPCDAGAHPDDPEPKEVEPFKSIKVILNRVHFIAENESESAALEMHNFQQLAVHYVLQVQDFKLRQAAQRASAEKAAKELWDTPILTEKGRELLASQKWDPDEAMGAW